MSVERAGGKWWSLVRRDWFEPYVRWKMYWTTKKRMTNKKSRKQNFRHCVDPHERLLLISENFLISIYFAFVILSVVGIFLWCSVIIVIIILNNFFSKFIFTARISFVRVCATFHYTHTHTHSKIAIIARAAYNTAREATQRDKCWNLLGEALSQ